MKHYLKIYLYSIELELPTKKGMWDMEIRAISTIVKRSFSEVFSRSKNKVFSSEVQKKHWFKAVQTSNYNYVKKAIKLGMHINVVNDRRQSALMIATYNRDIKLVELLVANGADVNLQDDRLNSPFLHACEEGYLEIIKLISEKADVKVTNRYGSMAISAASENAHYETLKFLLENTSSDVNYANHIGWTSLLAAVILGDGTEKYVKIVQLLLAYGASPNMADRDGMTAIEHAEKLGYKKILNLLIA